MNEQICARCELSQDLYQYGVYKYKGRDIRRKTCNSCRRAYEAARYKADPSLQTKKRAVALAHHFKSSYGLTTEQVLAMEEAQGYKCLICNETADKLHVDHCHGGGHVRGLLCGTCNRGLGMFKDNPENFQRAIQYLKGDINGTKINA